MDMLEMRKKAECGSVAAQSILGVSYLYGLDAEANYPEALRLLRAASDGGASRAVVNLARMHAEGIGVRRDVAEAVHLYEAVAKVEFFAALSLGRIYSNGMGVAADQNVARGWYSLALGWKDSASDSAIPEQIAWATGLPREADIQEAETFLSRSAAEGK
ncbi:MAG: hypothetical protein WA655_11475 [Candidatus Korobacteraceae bacterium]